MRFDILNRLGVAHECDRRTDRQTDRTAVTTTRSNDLRYKPARSVMSTSKTLTSRVEYIFVQLKIIS